MNSKLENSGAKLFQIYYDNQSRKMLDPKFIPLDNSDGPIELRESYPILNFFKNEECEPNSWYGFFSPKLYEKTLLNFDAVEKIVDQNKAKSDVVLLSSFWTTAASNLNVWHQGENCHPGLLDISQQLADKCGYSLNLSTVINTLGTAVFSHFLVAKMCFWEEWCHVVQTYLEMIENDKRLKNKTVAYHERELPIHAFVLERVPSMILTTGKYKTSFDLGAYNKQILLTSEKGKLFLSMNLCKEKFLQTGNHKWLSIFREICIDHNQKMVKEHSTQKIQKSTI